MLGWINCNTQTPEHKRQGRTKQAHEPNKNGEMNYAILQRDDDYTQPFKWELRIYLEKTKKLKK